MVKRDDLNIMANIKMIEKLKANLLCIIGEFYHLLTKGSNVAQDAILNCISGAVIILYVLAQKLGYSCKDVDDDIKNKLQVGIAEGHEYENDGRSLSKLQLHLKERH
ncbi:MazG-like family protein [Clostridium tertium]|uniref:MazG-like family protein n=1 Tax=Clostridium tertium TaxID=1559 RepID=A0A6N3GNP8_9CLOT